MSSRRVDNFLREAKKIGESQLPKWKRDQIKMERLEKALRSVQRNMETLSFRIKGFESRSKFEEISKQNQQLQGMDDEPPF